MNTTQPSTVEALYDRLQQLLDARPGAREDVAAKLRSTIRAYNLVIADLDRIEAHQ